MIVIAGPTAVGKTSTAIDIATQLQCNIINADSRQVFKEMSIGTAVPTAAELKQCTHYFVQDHSIKDDFHAGIFEEKSLKILSTEFESNDKIILSGGSGLYIKALLHGLDPMPEVPFLFREKYNLLYNEKGIEFLQKEIEKIDPEASKAIEISNPQRLIRALSFKEATGKSIVQFQKQKSHSRPFTSIKILLTRPRDDLYKRINHRVDIMMENGLYNEAKRLYPLKHYNGLQTVGYKELFDVIDGKSTIEDAINKIKQNSRRYAKRQITWFRNQDQFEVFHPDQTQEILNFITKKMN